MPIDIPDPVIGDEAKGFPDSARGARLSEVDALGLRLSDMETPVMTLDLARVRWNEELMLGWAERHGILLAPHGKTTMAPALWRSVLDAGAHAVTFATAWQARCAFAHGVDRIILANNLIDPVTVRALVRMLDERPERELRVWADSVEAVARLGAAVEDAEASRPVDVLVDLGAPEGRTGARSVEEALVVARAVADAPSLRLSGVAGYEGPFGADRTPQAIAHVGAYLDSMKDLVLRCFDETLLPDDGSAVVSVGGSAYPDLVAEHLAGLASRARLILRAGAFQAHDSDFYDSVSPFRSELGEPSLRAAAHVWARVISLPEPGLALLDAGKRDLPIDTGMPILERVLGGGRIEDAESDGPVRIEAVNDQHAFVRGPVVGSLRLGDVVRLGISHPCTAFDKWRVIATIEDSDDADPPITGAIATLF